MALKIAPLFCQFWSSVTLESTYPQKLPAAFGEVTQASDLAQGGSFEHGLQSKEWRLGPSSGNFRQLYLLKLSHVTSSSVA